MMTRRSSVIPDAQIALMTQQLSSKRKASKKSALSKKDDTDTDSETTVTKVVAVPKIKKTPVVVQNKVEVDEVEEIPKPLKKSTSKKVSAKSKSIESTTTTILNKENEKEAESGTNTVKPITLKKKKIAASSKIPIVVEPINIDQPENNNNNIVNNNNNQDIIMNDINNDNIKVKIEIEIKDNDVVLIDSTTSTLPVVDMSNLKRTIDKKQGKPISGRVWKQKNSSTRILTFHKIKKSNSTFEKKQFIRKENDRIKAKEKEIKEAIRQEKIHYAQSAKEAKRLKEENTKRSEVVQVIKDTKKLKRMSKKQLRLVKNA